MSWLLDIPSPGVCVVIESASDGVFSNMTIYTSEKEAGPFLRDWGTDHTVQVRTPGWTYTGRVTGFHNSGTDDVRLTVSTGTMEHSP
jgi:hypothetical protein